MKKLLAVAALTTLATVPAAAGAQFLSDAPDGLQRICTYAGGRGIYTNVRETRRLRVGLAQNCPSTFPAQDSGLAMPPTARLSLEQLAGESRLCTYEQAGTLWQRSLPSNRPCPLSAGQLQTRSAPGERR